jgi:3-methylcrotonyl-CoA carboxylase alpha subunit
LPLALAAAGVVAHALAQERALQGADPWSRRDGWRLHGGAHRRFDIEAAGVHHALTLVRRHDGALTMALDGQHMAFACDELGQDRFEIELDGQRHTLAVYALGESVAVFGEDGSTLVGEVDLLAHAAHAGAAGSLAAPMPGKIVSYLAKAGERVQRGQALAVMEAMKMEHTLHAPHDGVVAELRYAVGDQVAEGDALLRLEALS